MEISSDIKNMAERLYLAQVLENIKKYKKGLYSESKIFLAGEKTEDYDFFMNKEFDEAGISVERSIEGSPYYRVKDGRYYVNLAACDYEDLPPTMQKEIYCQALDILKIIKHCIKSQHDMANFSDVIVDWMNRMKVERFLENITKKEVNFLMSTKEELDILRSFDSEEKIWENYNKHKGNVDRAYYIPTAIDLLIEHFYEKEMDKIRKEKFSGTISYTDENIEEVQRLAGVEAVKQVQALPIETLVGGEEISSTLKYNLMGRFSTILKMVAYNSETQVHKEAEASGYHLLDQLGKWQNKTMELGESIMGREPLE